MYRMVNLYTGVGSRRVTKREKKRQRQGQFSFLLRDTEYVYMYVQDGKFVHWVRIKASHKKGEETAKARTLSGGRDKT
jgi:hypothetical protein